MTNRYLPSLLLILSLGGCAVGQDYQRPVLDVPSDYRFAVTAEAPAAAAEWWDQFNDPVLGRLVKTALERNADLRIATARLQEYRSTYVGTRGALYPQLTLPTTLTRSRQGPYPVQDVYQSGLSLSWELDFWGRIRRLSEASQADYLGQVHARQAVVLSLVSAVLSSYVELRELDSRLAIARRTQLDRQEAVRIARVRFDAGVISEMELKQATSENEGTIFNVQQLEQAVLQKENEVCVLLGRNPEPIPRGQAIQDLQIPKIPSGLPSDLLARRPDILQAEQALVAANARVGAAKANLFPTISLTGVYGSASNELSTLFTGPTRVWNFIPSVSIPVFSGGTLWAQLTASRARQEQALALYDKTIQSAFRESEDALVGITKTAERKATQARLVDEVSRYARLARLRYADGVTSFLEVLDSQRNLYTAEQGSVQAQSAALLAMIDLYKALGGDWEAATADRPKMPPTENLEQQKN